MAYYFSKSLDNTSFIEAVELITLKLKEAGFGVLTEIDMQQTLKNKLGEEILPYKILGACNPPFALKALKAENKIGTMLPCNVIVQQHEDHTIEISAVDPVASMQAIENNDLGGIATEIQSKLKSVIDGL